MSQHARENPEEPINHDWFALAKRITDHPVDPLLQLRSENDALRLVSIRAKYYIESTHTNCQTPFNCPTHALIRDLALVTGELPKVSEL
jgi:hypothetical protein